MDKELKDLLEEQNKAFDEFKKSNDELLKAKAEGKAVSELEAKVGSAEAEIARLSKELDEVAKKANRPGAAGNDEKAHIEAEHKAGWLKWIARVTMPGFPGWKRRRSAWVRRRTAVMPFPSSRIGKFYACCASSRPCVRCAAS